MCANSAAIQPRLRTMPRIVLLRCAAVHRGKASFKLNSAVLRSFGVSAKSTRASITARARAAGRGKAFVNFSRLHTTAYPSHSLIVGHYARTVDRLALIIKIG